MTRKLIIAAALALLLIGCGVPIKAVLVIVALGAGAYALFYMRDDVTALTPEPEEPGEKPSDVDDPYKPPAPSPIAPWSKPVKSFMERVAFYCRDAINRISSKDYGSDPILTDKQVRLSGIIQSAVRDHGKLIEKSILEALQDSERFAAWCEPAFKFSYGDTNYHKAATVQGAALATLPYGDGHQAHDSFAVDLIVYDKVTKNIAAYEIKRAHSDANSSAQLRIVRSLLLSYARDFKKLDAVKAETFSINYYGKKSGDGRLIAADLDNHFHAPVNGKVEEATRAYRDELQSILEATQ